MGSTFVKVHNSFKNANVTAESTTIVEVAQEYIEINEQLNLTNLTKTQINRMTRKNNVY